MKTALVEELCAQHYERVGPLLEALLGRIPVASASFPNGFEKPATAAQTWDKLFTVSQEIELPN